MKILQEVFLELFSMFMADARMTLIALALVAIAAAMLHFTAINPLWVGAFLLIGSIVNVVSAAVRETRIRQGKQ